MSLFSATREPRFVCPAWSFAIGLVFGFYPNSPLGLGIAVALAMASFGLALFSASASGTRVRGFLCIVGALGLMTGFGLRLDEAGKPPLRLPGPVGVPDTAQGSISGSALRLAPVGIRARVVTDSVPVRGGYIAYGLSAQGLIVAAPGIRGEYTTRGALRLFAREGPSLEAGSHIETRGRFVAGQAEPLLFAESDELMAEGPRDPVGRLRHGLRTAFLTALGRAAGLEGDSSPRTKKIAGLLIALLSGSRDGLDSEDAESFKKSGCAHILALSGQHLAVLAGLLSLIASPLLGPRWARVVSVVFAALFVFIAGTGPSLLRSLILSMAAAISFFSDRPQEGRNLVGLSFVLGLFLDPASARSLSFLLSHLAVLGLVLLGPRFEHLLLPIAPPFAAKALAASLAAQCATAPLIALTLGNFQPVGVVASVATGPIVTAFMWWGLGASLFCGIIPALSWLAAPVTAFLYEALRRTMAFFAAMPAPSLPTQGDRLAVALGVVAFAAFVYALPHVEHWAFARRYARGRAELRLSGGAEAATRSRRPRHDQALRAELSDQS